MGRNGYAPHRSFLRGNSWCSRHRSRCEIVVSVISLHRFPASSVTFRCLLEVSGLYRAFGIANVKTRRSGKRKIMGMGKLRTILAILLLAYSVLGAMPNGTAQEEVAGGAVALTADEVQANLNIVWTCVAAFLVFFMQAGFSGHASRISR